MVADGWLAVVKIVKMIVSGIWWPGHSLTVSKLRTTESEKHPRVVFTSPSIFDVKKKRMNYFVHMFEGGVHQYVKAPCTTTTGTPNTVPFSVNHLWGNNQETEP